MRKKRTGGGGSEGVRLEGRERGMSYHFTGHLPPCDAL